MRYCPKCHNEYPPGALECFDCHVPLQAGQRRRRVRVDVEDLFVPVALLIMFAIASSLLVVRVLVESGQADAPVLVMIASSQPVWLAALFGLGALFSGILLVAWLVRAIVR